MKRWPVVAAGVASVGGVLSVLVSCGVVRTPGYQRTIHEYSRAVTIDPTASDNEPLKWNVELQIAAGVKARIQARGHMDVVRVHYADERESRTLYDYKDYSSPVAIRRNGRKLFVCWAETLFGTAYWLLEYDLEQRREMQKRRVDPKDLSLP